MVHIKRGFLGLLAMTLMWCSWAQTEEQVHIYMDTVQMSTTEVRSGQTLAGSVTIKNVGSLDVQDVHIVADLIKTDPNDPNNSRVVVSQKDDSGITLLTGESKNITFSLAIPRGVAGTDFAVRGKITSKNGAGLAWRKSDIFEIQGKNSFLILQSAYLELLDASQYALQTGPLVPEQDPYIFVYIDAGNENINDKIFTVDHYDFSATTGEKVSSTTSIAEAVTGIEGVTHRLKIDISPLKPKVFESSIYLTDSEGDTSSSPLAVRWIRDGEIGTIQAIHADTGSSGKQLLLKLTGKPFDVNLEKPYVDQPAEIVYTLGDTQSRTHVTLTSSTTQAILPLPDRYQGTQDVHIQLISQTGKVLDDEKFSVTFPDIKSKNWLLFLGIFVLILILILMIFKKKSRSIITSLVFAVVLLGVVGDNSETYAQTPPSNTVIFSKSNTFASAYNKLKGDPEKVQANNPLCTSQGWKSPTITLNTISHTSTTFTCGSSLKIEWTATIDACTNQPSELYIWYTFGDTYVFPADVEGEFTTNRKWKKLYYKNYGKIGIINENQLEATLAIPAGVTADNVRLRFVVANNACGETQEFIPKIGANVVPVTCHTCTNPPANAQVCSGDDTELTTNTPASLTQTCGSTNKCEYTCSAGHKYVPGNGTIPASCVPITCITPSPAVVNAIPAANRPTWCPNAATTTTPIKIERWKHATENSYRTGNTAFTDTGHTVKDTSTQLGYMVPTTVTLSPPNTQLLKEHKKCDTSTPAKCQYIYLYNGISAPVGFTYSRDVGYAPTSEYGGAKVGLKTFKNSTGVYIIREGSTYTGFTHQTDIPEFYLYSSDTSITLRNTHLDYEFLTGNLDITSTYRARGIAAAGADICTATQKCEFYCADTNLPYFCARNNQCVATSAACETITIEKWDGNIADEGDIIIDAGKTANDTQNVVIGESAAFTIIVKNTSTVLLKDVVITDALADLACSKTTAQILTLAPKYRSANVPGVTQPDTDTNDFDPGEAFMYTCTQANFTQSTNSATVNAKTVVGNIDVTDTDTTTVVTSACTSTSAPSELKTSTDKPLINCTGDGIAGRTHFRYKITKNGSTLPADTFVSSETYPIGTVVVHPNTYSAGNYTVTCHYGTSSQVLTDMAQSTCTKQMEVKSGNDVQGCAGMGVGVKKSAGYDFNHTELNSTSSYEAIFNCQSRNSIATGLTNPFWLKVGTTNNPVTLGLWTNSSADGKTSVLSSPYIIPNTNTLMTCAVRVGDGYSTSAACQKSANINTCSPSSLVVDQASKLQCVPGATTSYSVSCNQNLPTATECSQNFGTSGIVYYRTTLSDPPAGCRDVTSNSANFTLGEKVFACERHCENVNLPGAAGLVQECGFRLPSGESVLVWTGDAATPPVLGANGCYTAANQGSYQGMSTVVQHDPDEPTLTPEYRLNGSVFTPQPNQWYNQSVRVTLTCDDSSTGPLSEACVCQDTLFEHATNNIPSSRIWTTSFIGNQYFRDKISFYADFTESTTSLSTYYARDTAGNHISTAVSPIKIDTVPPVVTPSSGSTNTINLAISDNASGIWKPTASALTTYSFGSSSGNRVLYKFASKNGAQDAVNALRTNCSFATNTSGLFDSGTANLGSLDVSINTANTSFNSDPASTTGQSLVYCAMDNAGNVTTGVYPTAYKGCFSESELNPTVNLLNYANLLTTGLIARLSPTPNPLYGYNRTENLNRGTCFMSQLSSNITEKITQLYDPKLVSTQLTVAWADGLDHLAKIKTSSTPNNKGYYYYKNSTPSTPAQINIDVIPNTISTGHRTVLVEGDVQITSNLSYSGDNNKVLVIIARKVGLSGGNIYIHPTVTNVDAILIAEGAVMNGVNFVQKNWISDGLSLTNRLTINGALWSSNHRGGSLKVELIGSNQTLATQVNTAGKYFVGSTLNTNLTPPTPTNSTTFNSLSAATDLERFRMIPVSDVSTQCTLHIVKRSLSGTNLPEILRSAPTSTCQF